MKNIENLSKISKVFLKMRLDSGNSEIVSKAADELITRHYRENLISNKNGNGTTYNLCERESNGKLFYTYEPVCPIQEVIGVS